MRHNAQSATVRMNANVDCASQLDVLELQANPFDTGFLFLDCSFAQFWEYYALMQSNMVHDSRVSTFIIFIEVHIKANCGVIPVSTSKLERLTSNVIV